MKRVLSLLIAAAAVFIPAFALGSAAGVTSVFDIGTSVRAQAMGGAYIAAANDASSLYFNPAALNTLDKIEVQAAYIPLFQDTAYNYVSTGFPTIDWGTFGFSFAMIKTDKIYFRNNEGLRLSESSQGIYEVIGGWGKDFFNDSFSAGLNLKLDYHNFDNYANDLSFGADIGAYYMIISDDAQQLNSGAVLKNALEPQFKLLTQVDRLPRQFLMGISYKRTITADIKTCVNLDAVVPVGADFDYKAGIEVNLFKYIYIRAGYNSYSIFSFGGGLELPGWASLDYGMFISELDTQNRFGLTGRFGESVSGLRKRKAELEEARVEKKAKELAAKELKQLREAMDKMAGEDKKKDYFKALHYTKALESYFDADLKRAQAEFMTVYDVDREYMSVAYYVSLVKNLLDRSKQGVYSEEILKLYRDGVALYLKEDYAGAKEAWDKILKIDKYNKLAIDNLKEVNSLLRDIEGMKGNK